MHQRKVDKKAQCLWSGDTPPGPHRFHSAAAGNEPPQLYPSEPLRRAVPWSEHSEVMGWEPSPLLGTVNLKMEKLPFVTSSIHEVRNIPKRHSVNTCANAIHWLCKEHVVRAGTRPWTGAQNISAALYSSNL
jgi:hypothetical protein